MESLSTSAEDADDISDSVLDLVEKPLSAEDKNLVPDNVSQDANIVDVSRDASCQLSILDSSEDPNSVNQPVISAPQVQPVVERAYESTTGGWEDYSHYLNAESIETGLTGVYSESPSLMFHSGYGYTPQLPPYGPYSPVTTPLPSASGDSPIYSQQFPFAAPYYSQTPTPSMSYLASPTAISQADLTVPVEHQGVFLADNSNPNGMLFRPRPDYPVPYNSFTKESFAGNSGNLGFYDLGQGFDGFRSGGFWPDWMKSPDRTGAITPLSSPAASPRPIGAFGRSGGPLSSGVAFQQQKASHGFASSDRGYLYGGMYNQAGNFVGPFPSFGTNGQSFIAIDKGRRRGKGNASLCSCNGALDFLNEQNRGPRATRPKNMSGEHNLADGSKIGNSTATPNHELYNRSEFSTDYSDAKFFIIKSYSEDNVHKSIKYGVWASTANGNKKLDSAYWEAKVKGDSCPVFLFFSVNASAQFCGVAEMVGPVDFERSVDYWQQDKWSGQFPVKWHIIKDVPNNMFRHIILENNDNKPVTNSRDTQEVKLEQGLEILSIFKKHEADMSVLDDFEFYEERQKAMLERKAQQQLLLQSNFTRPAPSVAAEELQYSGPKKSGIVINQMSKTFAQVVRLEGSKTADAQAVAKSRTATNETDSAHQPKV